MVMCSEPSQANLFCSVYLELEFSLISCCLILNIGNCFASYILNVLPIQYTNIYLKRIIFTEQYNSLDSLKMSCLSFISVLYFCCIIKRLHSNSLWFSKIYSFYAMLTV